MMTFFDNDEQEATSTIVNTVDVNCTSFHVVSSCGTNTQPIVFILVSDDHARECECADLFSVHSQHGNRR
jgi:hypothetical protein